MLNSKQLDRCVNILDSIKDTLKDRESLEEIGRASCRERV